METAESAARNDTESEVVRRLRGLAPAETRGEMQTYQRELQMSGVALERQPREFQRAFHMLEERVREMNGAVEQYMDMLRRDVFGAPTPATGESVNF